MSAAANGISATSFSPWPAPEDLTSEAEAPVIDAASTSDSALATTTLARLGIPMAWGFVGCAPAPALDARLSLDDARSLPPVERLL